MMNKAFFLLWTFGFLLIFPDSLKAQSQSETTSSCNCETVFADMLIKLERTYLQLTQWRAAGEEADYQARKKAYLARVKSIQAKDCTAFLNEFLSIFKDGHLGAFEFPDYSEGQLAEFKAHMKESRLSEAQLAEVTAAAVLANQEGTQTLVGQWTDGKSTFALTAEEDVYKAYIVSSTVDGISPGELKAVFSRTDNLYQGSYYSYTYSPRYARGGVYKEGTLWVAGSLIWRRTDSPFEREVAALHNETLTHPTFSQIDAQTVLLSIPSFLVSYQDFRAFIKEYETAIKAASFLIIDIRGNRGGNGIYFPLIELYATQNMEGSQGLVLTSPENLAYFQRLQKNSSKVYKPVVKRIEAQMGAIVDGPLYPGKKFKLDKNRSIKQVAILTDDACMSAAESFILHSRRSSDKVRVFGAPTAGVIDYTSVNALLLDSGNQRIYFGYPTGSLHKEIPENGYNATGILPDVPIAAEVVDKVGFIVKNLQK